MNKKVFIGSSSEAKDYLDILAKAINKEKSLKAVSWKDIFSLNNQSFLDSLIKETYLVDFAIFIATKDDIIKSRGEEKESPRDNILFEFGLFLSALGKERCFFIMEKKCKLLSDMQGIILLFFNEKNFNEKIKELIININEKKKNIPTLITTGLAFGYYKSFISKLKFSKINKINIFLSKKSFNENNYQTSTDFGVRKAFYKDNSKKDVFDYPTTLDVIDEVINKKQELSDNDKDIYKNRELNNFRNVIMQLVENENFGSKIFFKT